METEPYSSLTQLSYMSLYISTSFEMLFTNKIIITYKEAPEDVEKLVTQVLTAVLNTYVFLPYNSE